MKEERNFHSQSTAPRLQFSELTDPRPPPPSKKVLIFIDTIKTVSAFSFLSPLYPSV